MLLTFKILLDKRYIKKNNTYGLKLRIYQDGDYKECSIGINVGLDDWDEECQVVKTINLNHDIYNTKITRIKGRVKKAIFFNEDEEELITPEKIITQIKRLDKKQTVALKPDILKFGKEHILKLQNIGNIGNAICYSCAINKLQSFAKREKLLFEEVNYKFLERFKTKLLTEGLKVNSIANYLRTLRALFKRAIKEESLEAKYYPFINFKIAHEETINRSLTISHLKCIINHPIETNTAAWHHRNLFLLSFCFIGLNFCDLLTLTKTNFVNGRIVFRRKKTKKVYRILINPIAMSILKNYLSLSKKNDSEFILPFVINKKNPAILKKDIMQAIKNTNDHLKKIAKQCSSEVEITTYYARYTWANIAKSLGYSKDMIAEALGHNYGNKVTGIYLDNYSNEIIDTMNKKVIETCFG